MKQKFQGTMDSNLRGRIAGLSPEKRALLQQRLKEKGQESALKQVIPPRPAAESAPLSFAQERLWFLDQYEPGSTVYNMPRAFRLSGRLDISALERSLNEIVRRHETLRTTFRSVEGEPRQVVAAELTLPLPIIDLRDLSDDERAEAVCHRAAEVIRRPFDLGRGPLLRTMLLRLRQEEHILFLDMHHIVSDGWSMAIFFRELWALYEAYVAGRPSPLPELPIHYADYAVWQRSWLHGDLIESQLSYWRRQLENLAPLNLPADRPRPPVQTFHGGREALVLTKDLTRALKGLSRREGASLFMTLLAAFKILLYRLTGQDDVAVGSPIAGRHRAEIEGLIGCFLNTLVLRTQLSGDITFKELLARVREVCLDAYAHQDVPFEKLLEELRPERGLSRTPLFQVFFNMVNVPERVKPAGLQMEPVPFGDVESKFDLTIYVRETNGSLQFHWVYNTDLFDRERIQEMSRQYEKLLMQIAEDAARNIHAHSLLTPRARELLPNPGEALAADWFGSVHDRFAYQAGCRPDQIAVTDPSTSWTYAELNARSNQLAHYLLESGIQREEAVAVYAHRSASLAWALLGILKAGAAFLILDPAYPAARLIQYIRAAKPRGVIELQAAGTVSNELESIFRTTADFCVALPELTGVQADNTLEDYSAANPEIAIHPDDLAYVSYTSGSTGEPNGIMGTHGPLSHFLKWQGEEFALGSSDRFSFLSGLSHDPALRDIFAPLWAGGTLCIPNPEELGSPDYLSRWLKREEITIAHMTPTMIQLLPEIISEIAPRPRNNDAASALRYAFFGGDKLTKRDVSRFQSLFPSVTCVSFYGATETPQAMGHFVIPQQRDKGCGDEVTIEKIPVGRGIEGVQLLVLNDAEQLAGIGEVGEIHVRTPYLARGYLGDDALTHKRFVANPFTKIVADRLYKTGDKGRYLSDGTLEFIGRTDHQVKIRGFRIELGEIETVLSQHPAVREAVALAREDAPEENDGIKNKKSKIENLKSNKRLVAYVVPRLEASPTINELRSFIKQKLPEYMVPSVFIFLDSLPLTPNGKIDRKVLPAPDAGRPELRERFMASRTPTEEMLAGIWAKLLGVDKVGIRDNFFDLGGHSLLAVRLFAEIEKAFKKRPPLSGLFQEPTIEHLARLITQENPTTTPTSLVAIQPRGVKPPFFCVHELFGDVFCYANLARHLGDDQPFYALQARGLDGTEEPFAEIAAMAAHYIEAIRTVQPQGPYALGGLCFGGVVAFEMAQQLRSKGEMVSLVALLDSGVNSRRGRVAWWGSFLRNLPGDLPSWLIGSLQLNRAQWETLLRQKIRMARASLRHVFRLSRNGSHQDGVPVRVRELADLFQFSDQHRKVARAQYQALREYTPQVYPGRVTLFRARMQPFFSSHDPDKGWGRLAAGGLDIRVVPGNHLGMLQEPHVRVLAKQLRTCLDRAFTEVNVE